MHRHSMIQLNETPKSYINGVILYRHPLKAIFRDELDQDVSIMVIGEDTNFFITKTFDTDRFMTQPGVYIYGNLVYGIGFHKSRLVKFVETQLQLF